MQCSPFSWFVHTWICIHTYNTYSTLCFWESTADVTCHNIHIHEATVPKHRLSYTVTLVLVASLHWYWWPAIYTFPVIIITAGNMKIISTGSWCNRLHGIPILRTTRVCSKQYLARNPCCVTGCSHFGSADSCCSSSGIRAGLSRNA